MSMRAVPKVVLEVHRVQPRRSLQRNVIRTKPRVQTTYRLAGAELCVLSSCRRQRWTGKSRLRAFSPTLPGTFHAVSQRTGLSAKNSAGTNRRRIGPPLRFVSTHKISRSLPTRRVIRSRSRNSSSGIAYLRDSPPVISLNTETSIFGLIDFCARTLDFSSSIEST